MYIMYSETLEFNSKSKITFFSIFMIQFGRSEQVIYTNKALDSIDSKAKGALNSNSFRPNRIMKI